MKIFDYKVTFVVLFFIISAIFLAGFEIYKIKKLDSFLELQTKEAKHRYMGISLFPKDTSNLIFNYLINTREVINIFKHADKANDLEKEIIREKLYKHLLKIYNDLQGYHIQQLHFHLRNNDSFLRFHRPSKFGDNLTKVRKTIAYVNEFKVHVDGFEEGKIFNGYRYVYPLFDENKNHIGSVEVSHSIQSFKDIYQKAFRNISLGIVIDKNVIAEKLFKSENSNYEPSIINNQFMHQKSMIMSESVMRACDSIKTREDIKVKMKEYKDFSVAINDEKHKGIVSFIAISNPITKKNVAYAISFQQSDYLKYFYTDKLRQMLYLLCMVFLFILVIYYIVKYNKALIYKVYNDSLMNIYNRRFFESYLLESCKKQKRNNSDLSLIMFDVDHFKSINDIHGHDIGDNSLKFLAKIVQEHIRQTDVFARWGGEEFMLLVEVDLEKAHKIAENLRISIQKFTRENNEIPEFTCSFGVIGLDRAISLDEVCKEVDKKLYIAKDTGRNKVVI